MFYASLAPIGSTFCIPLHPFQQFCKNAKLEDKVLTADELRLKFISTLAIMIKTNSRRNPERGLIRYLHCFLMLDFNFWRFSVVWLSRNTLKPIKPLPCTRLWFSCTRTTWKRSSRSTIAIFGSNMTIGDSISISSWRNDKICWWKFSKNIPRKMSCRVRNALSA